MTLITLPHVFKSQSVSITSTWPCTWIQTNTLPVPPLTLSQILSPFRSACHGMPLWLVVVCLLDCHPLFVHAHGLIIARRALSLAVHSDEPAKTKQYYQNNFKANASSIKRALAILINNERTTPPDTCADTSVVIWSMRRILRFTIICSINILLPVHDSQRDAE